MRMSLVKRSKSCVLRDRLHDRAEVSCDRDRLVLATLKNLKGFIVSNNGNDNFNWILSRKLLSDQDDFFISQAAYLFSFQ